MSSLGPVTLSFGWDNASSTYDTAYLYDSSFYESTGPGSTLSAPAIVSSVSPFGWTLSATLTAPAVCEGSAAFGFQTSGILSLADPVSGTALFGWTLTGEASASVRIFSVSLGVSPAVSGSLALPVPQVGSLSVIVEDYQEALEIASDLAGGLLVCSEVQSSL